jgi:hypothetical protein
MSADRMSRLGDTLGDMRINFLLLDTFPKPFDEHGVAPCPLAIHADGDPVAGQHAGERRAGELRAVVCVENFRLAMLRGHLPGSRPQKAASS